MSFLRPIFSQLVGCLGVLPLLLIVTVTSPLWGPVVRAHFLLGERREIRRMKAAGRFVSWTDLLRVAGQGQQGTLIFEQAHKAGLRLWWTADDIKTISPHSLPDEEDIDYAFGNDSPFMSWMREHYTGPQGKALRTARVVKHSPGFAKIEDFDETGFRNVVPAVRWIWKEPPLQVADL